MVFCVEGMWKLRRLKRRMKASIWRIAGPRLPLCTEMWLKLTVKFYFRVEGSVQWYAQNCCSLFWWDIKMLTAKCQVSCFSSHNQESQIFIYEQHHQIVQSSPNRVKTPVCTLENLQPQEATHKHAWKYLRHVKMHFLHHSELTSLLNLHSLQHGLRRENKWHTRPHREAIWLPAKHLLA